MTKAKMLSLLEDEMVRVERDRKVDWQQWLALARVIYWMLYREVKNDLQGM